MCEFISCLFTFALGAIVGGLSLYYKLYYDIKDFEKKYNTVLITVGSKDEI